MPIHNSLAQVKYQTHSTLCYKSMTYLCIKRLISPGIFTSNKLCLYFLKEKRLPASLQPGHFAWPPGQHRQGPPDLPLEIEEALDEVVEKGAHRPNDMCLLAASGAERSLQRRSTIQAVLLVRVAVSGKLAGLRLDCAREQASRYHIADRVDSVHQHPLRATLCSLRRAC